MTIDVNHFASIDSLLKAKSVEQPDCSKLIGCYYNHISEIVESSWDNEIFPLIIKERGLVVKTIVSFLYDPRRTWEMSFVYYKDIPFMLIQNAGREGDDHSMRYIFNKEWYLQCIRDLKEPVIEEYETKFVDDIHAINLSYVRFYQNDIANSEFFDMVKIPFEI